ncbi:MAG: UUP1 family membrane protein, partial [Alphaproteobacteria bacterium]|nr:UUP1 family membrane protein [Alphaproteobacteria bacterium]
MKNRHLYVLSALLAAIGLGFFFYKVFFLNLPLRPDERVVNWEVQARINFEARNEPVTLSLFVPQSEERFTIVDQSFVS